jgi:MFS family permease
VAACGEVTLFNATNYATSLTAALLIGIGLAAAFPVVLGYVGDRYPKQSGTAFSTIFVIALIGNMTINKTFGYIAQIHGIQQYAKVMLVLLSCSAVLLALVIRLLQPNGALRDEQ